jgi:hypothetical protein
MMIETVTVFKYKVSGIGNIGRIYPYLGSVPSIRHGARIWKAVNSI